MNSFRDSTDNWYPRRPKSAVNARTWDIEGRDCLRHWKSARKLWQNTGKRESSLTLSFYFIYFFILNNIYWGVPGSARLVWMGPWWKEKTTQKTITDKKKLEQLSIAKVLEAQFGLDLKCLFRPNPNLFKSCSLLRASGSVFQILAPLNLREPWYSCT